MQNIKLHSVSPPPLPPPAAASLQGMPVLLWDGRALLAEEESTHLFSFSSLFNPFPTALKSPQACAPLFPHLNPFSYTVLYCIWIEWKSNKKYWIFFSFFRAFAWSNESMSRRFESLCCILKPKSPVPPVSEMLHPCPDERQNGDQITTVGLNSVPDRLINLFCFCSSIPTE